jgi:hypothetical protein
VILAVMGILAVRGTARGTDFAPAMAADLPPAPASGGLVSSTAWSAETAPGTDVLHATVAFPGDVEAMQDQTGQDEAVIGEEPAAPPATIQATPATAVVPVVAAPPARTAAPQPVRTPAPTVAPLPTESAPLPTTCPATWFCYPRLGIAGPIVPYTDCSGGTDVGTAIRSYSCLSDNYLMGHAYTQFGLVRQWAAGDVVFAWGRRFAVSGAVTQQSCGAPSFPLAALSMQTSLTSSACGAVLVVQAR